MRLQGQLPQQPLLRHYYEHHDEHYDKHYDKHDHDLDDDAYVPTESNRPLHRRHSVL
jgi:hypothetical protein